jgi:hypothetical protein
MSAEGNHRFETITPTLGSGAVPPPGWRPIGEFPLLIMVGGTGSGKSVAIQEITRRWHPDALHVLPNRRELTDRLVVAPLQRADGLEVRALGRMEKLAYIRRFRERHPSGLAYAFAQLWADGSRLNGNDLLVFDGLRGEEEVRFAVEALPQARFAALDAPVFVRLCRLVERRDAYDTISGPPTRPLPNVAEGMLCERLGVPDACGMFSLEEEAALLGLLAGGQVTEKDLRDRLKVLAGEHSLYDVRAAIRLLEQLAPQRTLVVDTTTHNPQQVGERMLAFISLAFKGLLSAPRQQLDQYHEPITN